MRLWIVLVCALVILFATSAEAMHFHSDFTPDHPQSKKGACLICHVMHAPAVSSPVVSFGANIVVYGSALLPDPPVDSRGLAFGFYVRPPPMTA